MSKASDESKREWQRLHRRGLGAATQSEVRAGARLRAPLESHHAEVRRVVRETEHLPADERMGLVSKAIGQRAKPLRRDLEQAIADTHRDSRLEGRAQHEAEMHWVGRQIAGEGHKPPRIKSGLSAQQQYFNLRAGMAADSLASAYKTHALLELTDWHRGKGAPKDLDKGFSAILPRLYKRAETTSATESTYAFGHEHATATREVHGHEDHRAWRDGLHEVWSSTLDSKTCPRCWQHDGEIVRVGDKFKEGARTPVHPRCRCRILAIYLGKHDLRKLPGIESDYAALKEDIGDFYRAQDLSGMTGRKHALPYIKQSVKRTSPEALTDALGKRAYTR